MCGAVFHRGTAHHSSPFLFVNPFERTRPVMSSIPSFYLSVQLTSLDVTVQKNMVSSGLSVQVQNKRIKVLTPAHGSPESALACEGKRPMTNLYHLFNSAYRVLKAGQ